MNKLMNLIGIKARKASEKKINTKVKNKVLSNYALLLDREKKSIFRENKKQELLKIKRPGIDFLVTTIYVKN